MRLRNRNRGTAGQQGENLGNLGYFADTIRTQEAPDLFYVHIGNGVWG
jgi:hypothetical protein